MFSHSAPRHAGIREMIWKLQIDFSHIYLSRLCFCWRPCPGALAFANPHLTLGCHCRARSNDLRWESLVPRRLCFFLLLSTQLQAVFSILTVTLVRRLPVSPFINKPRDLCLVPTYNDAHPFCPRCLPLCSNCSQSWLVNAAHPYRQHHRYSQ
jgi:hypothetical protein